jgi:hypothetical protein
MSSKLRHIEKSNILLEERYLIEQKSDYLIDKQSNAIMTSVGIRPKKDYEKVNKTIDNSISMPLHYRAAAKFLLRETKPLTNTDFGDKSISVLSDVLCNKSKLMKTCDASKWFGFNRKKETNKNTLYYEDYTIKYPKSPSYNQTNFTYDGQPANIKELMLTLGSSTITTTGNNWVLTDDYNFDNIMEFKPYLKTDSFLGLIKNSLKSLLTIGKDLIRGRGIEAGVEELLSQYHNTGYPGYKIKLTIPMGNCKCKNP